MKLQIDTLAKTIKVEQIVKIKEFIEVLQKLLPLDWQDYSIETNSVIYWPTYPIITYQPYQPITPIWEFPHITCGTTCNVEIY